MTPINKFSPLPGLCGHLPTRFWEIHGILIRRLRFRGVLREALTLEVG